jgi:hypothetical protein
MNIQSIPNEALQEILSLKEAAVRLDLRDKAQNDFMAFAHHVYENFIEGRHHRIIAKKLEEVAAGKCKRLIINMPPRHSKSEFASYLMPAWFLGRNPKLKIIQATHNTELAVRFGRKVRDLIDDPQYTDIFPQTSLKTTKVRENGRQIGVVSTLQRVLALRLRVVVLIYLLLMTLIQSKTLFRRVLLTMRMSGTRLGPDNVYNRVVQS